MTSVNLVPQEVLSAYCAEPSLCSVSSLGQGNINDTFLINTPSDSFVLQRINGKVFPEPLRVAANFSCVSRYLSTHQGKKGGTLQVASPVLTLDGQYFARDAQKKIWRGQSFIKHKSFKVLTTTIQAYQVGRTLALFHSRLFGLDGTRLLDPLPGFHNLPGYLKDYDRQLEGPIPDGSTDNSEDYCITVIDRFRDRSATLEDAKKQGSLRLQPVHGDPKLENIIFDDKGQARGLLDLDTVAMGLVHHDLGDCLRSCCNILGEEGEDFESINFQLDFCQGLLEGYFSSLASCQNRLSAIECDYIFDGLLLICFELALRFFTDHLRGNLYFKVEKDGDNLRRARRQFRLTEDVAAKEEQIRAIIQAASC